MEKIRGKYDNWIILIISIVLGIALLIAGVKNNKSQSLINGLEMQVREQTEQMEQMIYALERYKEMEKTHQLERSIFDDIINDRSLLHMGLTPTSDPLSSENSIKY